ncbi:uncharacterized protein LOC113789266 [Dermatophagoides pteronyssinus]|uniref:uncharacterized protein LOC113789266 n=1 Tax=Dermatophagoides pteronyssinus TaxID=6956 RepID=UPI003F6742AB
MSAQNELDIENTNENVVESKFIIKSNYFFLDFLPIIIYKYSVQITPDNYPKDDYDKIIKCYIKKNFLSWLGCYYEDGFIYSSTIINFREIDYKAIKWCCGLYYNEFTIYLKQIGQFNSVIEAGINLKNFFLFSVQKKKKLIDSGIFIQIDDRISVGFRLSINLIKEPLIFISRHPVLYNGKYHISNNSLPSESVSAFNEEMKRCPKEEFEFFKICCAEIENCVKSFGINIDSEPFETNGTLLFHPELIPDSPDKPFFNKPSNMINFAILCFHPFDSDKMKKLEDSFVKKAKKFEMNFEKCFDTQFVDIQNDLEIATVFQNLKIRDIHFVFIGYSQRSRKSFVVEKIKSHTTNNRGLVTQIFIIEKVDMIVDIPKFFDHLAITSCLKLGGQPNIIDPNYWIIFPFEPQSTMIVGTSFQQFRLDNIREDIFLHSIVASMDKNFCQNICIERFSIEPNDEKLFEEMFRNSLEEYQKEHGEYPKNIIIFHGKKYTDLKSAAKSIDERIKMTSFSVDKFTPIRFIKNDDGNVPIGTCVKLVQLDGWPKEFVICTEIGADGGRCKTTQYTVINDDSGMSDIQIKHLCYAMCHFYFDNFYINDIPYPLELAEYFAKSAITRCLGRNELNPIDSIEEVFENFSRKVRIHGYREYPVDD